MGPGYDGASLRAIAARAGVDSAFVGHFFTDEQTLFTTVMATAVATARVTATVTAQRTAIPQRIADASRRSWEDDVAGPVLPRLVCSAMTSDHAAGLPRDMLSQRIRSDRPAAADDPPVGGPPSGYGVGVNAPARAAWRLCRRSVS